MTSVNYSLWILAWLVVLTSHAQDNQHVTRMSAKTFLEAVNRHEDIRQAEAEVDRAELDIELASISPAPVLTFGNACGDITGISMPHQLYAGLDFTIETGGKKRNRVRLSRAQSELARIRYASFVRNFRRDAILLFNSCWLEESQLTTLRKLHLQLTAMSTSDTLSSLQKRIKLREIQLELTDLDTQLQTHLHELNELVEQPQGITIIPAGSPWDEYHDLLAEEPSENDILLLEENASATAAHCELTSEQSNQKGDVTFSLGNSFMTRARNPEAPSPPYNAITATLAFPIRFSSNRPSSQMAKLKKKSINDQSSAAIDEIKGQWQHRSQQRQRLLNELTTLESVIADQELLITLTTRSAPNEVIEEIDDLHEMKKREFAAKQDLARINADVFFHNDKQTSAYTAKKNQ